MTARFRKALVLATCLHEGQGRKGTTRPYIGHLLGVTSLVLQYGGDEEMAIGALLHDAIEDHGDKITLDFIARKFGPRVAKIVEGCTDSFTTPKLPWRQRKEEYIARVRREPADVRLVSAADKLCNCRELLQDYRQSGEAIWTRFQGGKEGTLWYYRALADEFRGSGSSPLAEELQRTVAEIEGLAAQTQRENRASI